MRKTLYLLASVVMLLAMPRQTAGAQTLEDSLANLSDEALRAYYDSIYDSRHPSIELSTHQATDNVKKPPLRQKRDFSYSNSYVPSSASVITSRAVGQIEIVPGVSPSGGKTYTIPIHGYKMEGAFCPDISLTYNSQGGGNSCGKGWSIGGLQTITRGNKSIYYDGKSDGIKMNAEDAFYLNGVRLLRTSSTAYEYETEQGSIKAVAEVSDTIVKYFNVYYPNGYTAVFGMTYTTTSKLEYPITQLTDDRGRSITFYYDSNYGNYWVTTIYYDYGSASMSFTYDQTRADYIQGYRGGLPLDNHNLLKSITCKRFTDEIGTYKLSYTTNNTVSLLTQVDFSADGTYLNPLRFYYGDNSALQEYETSSAILTTGYDYHRSNISAVRGRFDYHTGTDGFIIYPNSNPYYHVSSGSSNYFYNKFNSSNELLVYYELNQNGSYNFAPSISLGSYFVTALTADLDGNQQESIIKVGNGVVGGLDEIMFDVYWKTNPGLTHRFHRFFYGPAVHTDGKGNKSVTPKSFFAGDFNGDGKMDIMVVTADNPFGETGNPSMCYIYDLVNFTTLYSGQLLTYHREFESSSINSTTANAKSDRIIPFDYDGDGKTDLCHISDSGMDVYTFIKNPSNNTVTAKKVATYPTLTRWVIENRDLAVGDFNGDGLMDFVLSDAKNQYGTNSWRFILSKGDGTFGLEVVTGPSTTNSTSEFVVQDVNGDGISDVIELTDNDFTTYLVRNNTMTKGVTHSLNLEGENLLPVNLYSSSLSTQFVSFRDNSVTFYSYKTNQRLDQALTGVVNSNAVVEKNYYYTIKRDNQQIYTKGALVSFPYSNAYEAIPILAGSEVFKGGSSVDINKYYYTNAIVHRQGLGFCGFESVRALNKRGQNSTSTYLPTNHSLLASTDTPTSAASYDYSVTVDSFKRLKALVTTKTETDKLRNVTATTAYAYDNYGQVLTENTSLPGSITVNKSHTYSHKTDISSRYHLGLMASTTTTTTRGSSQHTEQATVTSFNSFDQPLTIINKVNGYVAKTTAYTYDAYGNMTSKSVNPYSSTTARTSTYQYNSEKRLSVTTDPTNAQRSYSYNTDGTVASVSTGHGTTSYTYDSFGRVASETRPDNTVQNTAYTWSTVNGGLYAVTTTTTNEPTTTVYYDALNREVRSTQQRFDGTMLNVDKTYDTYGNLSKQSYPYKTGSPTYKQYSYDSYNRLTSKSEAGKTTSYSYSGLSTTVSDGTMSTTTTTDALDGVVSVTDPAGTVTYTLNGAGNPTSISAPTSSGSAPTTTIAYDTYGRRTSITDPSHGTTTYAYHTTEGYLQSETNAKGQTTSYVCDLAGRVTQRTTQEFSTSYTYDNDLNEVTAETSTNGTSTTYTYDGAGRLSSTKETGAGGKWLQRDYTYSDGKVSTILYTSQSGELATEVYTYTNGHLTNVALSNHMPVFHLNSEDNNGHTTSVTVLGMTRTYGFTVSGLPTSRSVTSGSTTFQGLTYNFNPATGNLTGIYNACNGLTESYTYDNLHRLTNYGGTAVAYDSNGNITTKGDVGTFSYNVSGKPYAVSDVTLTKSLQVGTQYVSYYSFDRPSMISDNGYTATFTYNGSYDRVKMEMLHNSQSTLTRYYLGGCYELDEKPSGNMEKLYLFGGYYDSPLVLVKQNGSTNYYMVFRDHLGSITRVMGQQELSYDAWGRLRNPSTYEPYAPGSEPTLFLGRGYCGHEHLPEFGLINMNARLYDPLLGRFLSTDPYVQAPEHTQSFNRYSYCMNNPLRYSDITGEWFGIDDLIAALVGGCINLGTNLISGEIKSVLHGVSSFALGMAAGEAALYGQAEISAVIVGVGNSIINQGFTNGFNNISWGDVAFSGAMSVALSALGNQVSNLFSAQISPFLNNISNDVLRSTIEGGVISSLTGFVLEGGLSLANGSNLSDAFSNGLKGAQLGFVSGSISGLGTGISEARKNKTSPWTGERTEMHHSDSKFMGGDKNQTLTTMSKSRHQELHNDMYDFLRQQTNEAGKHMRPQRGNPGKAIQKNFSRYQRLNALKSFYDSHPFKYWDARYDFYRNNNIRYTPW